MNLLVFPSALVSALDPDNPRACVPGTVHPLDSAWDRLPSDAHTVGYLPQDGSRVCPRLRKSQAEWATQHDVKLQWLCFDIDNPDHAQWDSPQQAADALANAFGLLPPELEEYAGGYTTPAGYRLVWCLRNPIDVKYGDHVLRTLGERLCAVGIAVDPACYQWTRLFRLPRATRPGYGQLTSTTDEPRELPGSIFDVLNIQPTEENYAAPLDDDMPTEPTDVPDWVLNRGCVRFPGIPRGEPFEPDEGGSIYRQVVAAMASISANARITQPGLLISVVWASIEASGRDPSEFWRFACWVCAQQECSQVEAITVPKWEDEQPKAGNPPASWWKGVRELAKATGKKTPPDIVRGFKSQGPISIPRTTFRTAAEELCKLVAGTPYGEDPSQVYGAMLAGHKSTGNTRCDTQDLWEWAKEAAEESWEEKKRKAEKDRAVQTAGELLDSWPLLLSAGGNKVWVLDPRNGPGKWTYRPCDSHTAVVMARKYQTDLPIDVVAMTSTEKGSPISVNHALDTLGAFVDGVVYKSGIQRARFSPDRRQLFLPCHRMRPIEPRYSSMVDEWLKVFAGDQYDRLCRWVGAVALTNLGPLAALYLQGSPGCGKSLFCLGLSKLWVEGQVDYNRVAQSEFNGALLRSPLLIADEGIVQAKYNSSAPSALFRSYTANRNHVVRKMYQSPLPLESYLRVVITANGSDAIPFQDTLGKAGMDAIVERVFWVEAQPEARAYLENTVTPPYIQKNWVEGDEIAQHFAWLGMNEVRPEGRFLVAGTQTVWHEQFVLNQGLKPEMLTVLGHLVEQAVQAGGHKPGVIVTHKRHLLVHRQEIEKAWFMATSTNIPPLRRVRKTLKAMSLGCERYDDQGVADHEGLWYHLIDWNVIIGADVLPLRVRKKLWNLWSE